MKSETNIDELSERIIAGVQKALLKLTEESAKNNEELVIADKDGQIKSVPAKELLKQINSSESSRP